MNRLFGKKMGKPLGVFLLTLALITLLPFSSPRTQAGSAEMNNTVNPVFLLSLGSSREWQIAPFSSEFEKWLANSRGAQAPNYGWVPSPHDFSYLKGSVPGEIQSIPSYPSYYDLRNAGKVSPIKDQGAYRTCWAFAAFGSLESRLLPEELWDFSEDNLVNLHGFDRGYNDGGNYFMATAYLARWSGPVSESDDPYSDHYSPPGLPLKKHVQEVLYLPPRSWALDNNLIKWALMNYGGVGTNIYWDNSYYTSSTKSYYYSGPADTNHAVVIVGWDDNYDRKKFAGASGMPQGNGAFIVRNSWGTSFGESGYFYVSYYDSQIGQVNAVFNNAEPISNYTRIYQYDTLGWTSGLGSQLGSETGWFAAVFQTTSTVTLSAVAFYSASMDSSYEIYLQPSYNGSNMKGSLVASGTLSFPGFHTVSFSAQQVPSGYFAVAVKLTTPGYYYPVPIEEPISGYTDTATALAGQTFVSLNGVSWQDLTSVVGGASVCLKAYTQESFPVQPAISFSPSTFTFTGTQGGLNPPSQTLEVWNSGGGSMNWTASKDVNWLTLSPSSGNSSGEHDQIAISVNISGLSSGTYSATITLTGEGALNSPQDIPVTLQVLSPLPSLQILSPNGGELWIIGSTKNILWTSTGVTGNVKIELNRNYPSGSWEVLFASIPNDGSESWVVTGPVSSACRIRISSLDDPSIYDLSDGNFLISQVSGNTLSVNFQIPSSQPYNAQFLLSFYSPGSSNLLFTVSQSAPSNGGSFLVSDIPQGTYDIRLKEAQCVSVKLYGVNISSGSTTLNFGTLRLGDINNDDRINIYDFSILAGSYGKSQGQVGFVAQADLNHDNIVNIYDFSILAGNYGLSGPA